MKQYNLESVHEAVGEAYKIAQDVQNPDLQESMIEGVVKLAYQARAADELDEIGLFEQAEAMEYGSEGMGDIYISGKAAKKQAEDYRKVFAEVMSGETNPLQQAEVIERGIKQSAEQVKRGEQPLKNPDQINKDISQLEQLQEHFEYGEAAQRDAAMADSITDEAAKAYAGSLKVLMDDEEALKRRQESNLEQGDEDTMLAMEAVEQLAPKLNQ